MFCKIDNCHFAVAKFYSKRWHNKKTEGVEMAGYLRRFFDAETNEYVNFDYLKKENKTNIFIYAYTNDWNGNTIPEHQVSGTLKNGSGEFLLDISMILHGEKVDLVILDQNTEPDFSAGWEAHRQAEKASSKTVRISRHEVEKIVVTDLVEKYEHYVRYFSESKPNSIKKLRDVLKGWYLFEDEMQALDEAIKLGPLPDDPLEIFREGEKDEHEK